MTDKAPEAQPAEKPAARIVSGKPREKVVPIENHIEFDGAIYTQVTVRRVTGKEINDYLDSLSAKAGGTIVPPMVDCPVEVWDAMDDDDRYLVEKAMFDFFPQRLRDMAGSVSPASEDASAQ